MPSSSPAIALKAVSHKLPDGTALFTHLDVSFPATRTGLVGRNGVGKSTLLHLIAGRLPVQSGHIHVHGKLRMLHQNPAGLPGGTIADLFAVREPRAILARIEAGTGSEADFSAADWTLDARLAEALDRAGLPGVPPDHALTALSGGQVTRAALAALTFDAPEFILLDEPTNNLDTDGRTLVRDLMRSWQGGALVISHDRTLLNEMDQIAELTSLGLSLYGGNWDAYRARKATELAAAESTLSDAERALKTVERKAQRQKERKARKDSAGKAGRAKNDAPKAMLNFMRNRSEKSGGDGANLASRMKSQATDSVAEAKSRLEVLQPVKLALPPTGLPAGRRVLTAKTLTGGYGTGPNIVSGFDLELIGPERVALTGPNGSGKSTVLALLTGALTPRAGTAEIHVPHVMMDQAVSLLDPALSIRDNYLKINPDEDETACRAALARFRFRGEAADKPVGELSGGQRLGAGLAATIGAGTPPLLLILDEPTNHLDLDALEAIETGLSAYDGALLVVSHDRAFLEAIGITREVGLT